IRAGIDTLDIDEQIRSVLLVSLIEAADRIDSTCGIQMAFLKGWAPRAHLPLTLRVPSLLEAQSGTSYQAHCLDAKEAAQKIECDIAYLDPPYNQHSYRSNYHIWETLVRNDRPELYGRAQKRLDCQTYKSDFNSKPKFRSSLLEVLSNLNTRKIVLSFSDEGFITKSEIETLLSQFGKVSSQQIDYKRYVGAQIGIYNQKGRKVGQIKKLRNKEFLYVVNPT
ncbi:MAG: DNA adenine methylase, partial [Myxococcales bacterium]|nr:DNA adenine methylase [Myxococcales bacterium]